MELSKIASANIEKALSTFLSVLADTSKKVTPYSFAIASPFSYDFFKVTKDFLYTRAPLRQGAASTGLRSNLAGSTQWQNLKEQGLYFLPSNH